jgi:agmatinase
MPASQPPFNFLGLDPEFCDHAKSQALVLPVPYELTTSYGHGTKNGPQAIIEASRQVEFYDRELLMEPALAWGIHTLPFLSPNLGSPEAAIADIQSAVRNYAGAGKLLAVLGGEHGMSVGVARGLAGIHGEFVTVQLDAHADLRDNYEGTPYSHACAARRILEQSRILQIGIRSLDITEAEFLQKNAERVSCIPAELLQSGRAYLDRIAEFVSGKNVFLTIDLDVFDSSLMPATGTPEPGGLFWHDVLAIIQTVAREGNVIGFDCVELSPIPGLHAPDFLAAKLVYKTISLILNKRLAS